MKQTMIRVAVVVALIGWMLLIPSRADDGKTSKSPEARLQSFNGEIISIEKATKVIQVRKFPLSKTFLVAVTCKITTTDKPDATLKDLKVGDMVKLKYEEAEDGLIARQIIIRGIDAEDREDARAKEKLERH